MTIVAVTIAVYMEGYTCTRIRRAGIAGSSRQRCFGVPVCLVS